MTPPTLASIGVPTTTRIAFVWNDELYLEQMNILSEAGCGVLCPTIPDVGTILKVVFRLSTAKDATRCTAEVLGPVPTTPAGLALRKAHGDKAPPVVPSGGVSDSATAIFRLGDLQRSASTAPAVAPAPGPATAPASGAPAVAITGFCIHFLSPDAAAKAALAHHLQTSRALADRIAAQEGRSVAQDRLAIAETFHEGDLSKRALDW